MNTFFISDTHFSHANCLTFLRNDGTKMRNFSCIEEMDETIVDNWNRVVKPSDKVYHLGDVVMGTSSTSLNILSRLNGAKVLIKGNHDKCKLSQYQTYFKDVRGSHQFDGMILTHIPLHPGSLARWGVNVHGHLHHNVVTKTNNWEQEVPDYRYFNVSVEQIDFTPISLEEVKKLAQERKDSEIE